MSLIVKISSNTMFDAFEVMVVQAEGEWKKWKAPKVANARYRKRARRARRSPPFAILGRVWATSCHIAASLLIEVAQSGKVEHLCS